MAWKGKADEMTSWEIKSRCSNTVDRQSMRQTIHASNTIQRVTKKERSEKNSFPVYPTHSPSSVGTYMLRYKQSSFCSCIYVATISKLNVNQMGIMISGTALWMFCGHTGAKCVAFLMPDHDEGGSGGRNRFSATGGAA